MDRRQRKTRQAIYQAFEELMATEHYEEVTVSQIIERADIGRSTFYAHFETKDELLDQMCTEMFDHVFEGVSARCETHRDLDDEGAEGRLAHLLFHLRDTHSGVCGRLLAQGEPHFTQDFRRRLRTLLEDFAPAPSKDMPEDLRFRVQTGAFLEAVGWWFAHGCKEDPRLIASWYLELTSGCHADSGTC